MAEADLTAISALAPPPADAPGGILSTGFQSLDEILCGGIRRGSLTAVVGIPGVGTSTFALNIATRAAIQHRVPTLFMAPDSDEHEIRLRVISASARIPMLHLRAGRLNEDDRRRLTSHYEKLDHGKLFISANWLRPSNQPLAENIADYAPLGLAVADQIPDGRHSVRALKVQAQQHNIAVIVTVKTTLRAAPDGLQRPQLVDMRLADEVAEYSDLVLGLHRPEMFGREPSRAGDADLEVLKHRYGPTALLPPIAFQGHYARFVETARVGAL